MTSSSATRRRAGRPRKGRELDLARIVELRARARLSHAQIARVLGCSRQAVSLRLRRDAELQESEVRE